MTRKNWLVIALSLTPLLLAGGLFARSQIGTGAGSEQGHESFVCPLTGEELPCEKCCPLNEKAAQSEAPAASEKESGYVCPLTGEDLPCEKCCPLDREVARPPASDDKALSPGDYICPLTGEELPCEKCCPLEQQG